VQQRSILSLLMRSLFEELRSLPSLRWRDHPAPEIGKRLVKALQHVFFSLDQQCGNHGERRSYGTQSVVEY
jgi:hypothetical protein